MTPGGARALASGALLASGLLGIAQVATGAPATPQSQGPATQPPGAREPLAPGISGARFGVGATATAWTFLTPAAAQRAGAEILDDAGVAALATPGDVVAALTVPSALVVAERRLDVRPTGALAMFGSTFATGALNVRGWWQAADDPRRIPLDARSRLLWAGEVSPEGARVAGLGAAPPLNTTATRTIGTMGARAAGELRLAVVRPTTRERRALTPGKRVRIHLDAAPFAPRWALDGGSGTGPAGAALAGNRRGELAWVIAEEGPMERDALAAALRAQGFDRIYSWGGGGGVIGATVVHPVAGVAVIARHAGVRIEQAPARLLPGGDGVADRAPVRIVAPTAGRVELAIARPGAPPVSLTGQDLTAATRLGVALDPEKQGLAAGRYTLSATLTPTDGTAPSVARRSVVIDPTLRRYALARTRQGARPATALLIGLARPARVRGSVRTPAGRWVSLGPWRAYGAGAVRLEWDGRIGTGDAPPGDYTVRVQVRSDLGISVLERRLTMTAATGRIGGDKAQSTLPTG